jgi:hypothetical protein
VAPKAMHRVDRDDLLACILQQLAGGATGRAVGEGPAPIVGGRYVRGIPQFY